MRTCLFLSYLAKAILFNLHSISRLNLNNSLENISIPVVHHYFRIFFLQTFSPYEGKFLCNQRKRMKVIVNTKRRF